MGLKLDWRFPLQKRFSLEKRFSLRKNISFTKDKTKMVQGAARSYCQRILRPGNQRYVRQRKILIRKTVGWNTGFT
ncbi:MAG: hypothetical protein LUD07_03975 [Clostridiales bacterium]|nr:hypothetical protein [Clostridiales bacterium]